MPDKDIMDLLLDDAEGDQLDSHGDEAGQDEIPAIPPPEPSYLADPNFDDSAALEVVQIEEENPSEVVRTDSAVSNSNAGTVVSGKGLANTGAHAIAPTMTRSVTLSGKIVGGRYALQRQLGSGAHGRVYLATDQHLNRQVAVKILREYALLAKNDAVNLQQRFEKEHELPAQLSHPNIVTIIDRGFHEDLPYYVMTYHADAKTLQQTINDHRQEKTFIPLDLLRTYIAHGASALASIHATGSLHRDIKVENLLIYELPGGIPMLTILDFGVAHYKGSDLTVAGQVLGTPSSLAPENWDCHAEPGPAADLYSLGIAFYMAATNCKALPQLDPRSWIDMYRPGSKVLPPKPYLPRKLRPDLPAHWETLILRLLEPRADKRIGSATELLQQIASMESLGEYSGDAARAEDPPDEMRTTGQYADSPTANLASAPTSPSSKPAPESEQPVKPPPPPEPTADGGAQPEAAEKSQPAPPTAEASEAQERPQEGPQDAPQGTSISEMPAKPSEPVHAPAPKPPPPSPQNADLARRKRIGKIILAATVATVVFGLFAAGIWALESVDATMPQTEWAMPGEAPPPENESQWIDDIKSAKPLFARNAAPPPTETKTAAAKEQQSAPVAVSPQTATRISRRATKTQPKSPPVAPPEPPKKTQLDEWEELYGQDNLGQSLASGSVGSTPGTTGAQAGTAGARGQRIPVQLLHAIAGDPTGAPVIATLTKTTRVGALTLPAGTEIHGSVTGSNISARRIYIRFIFARKKKGGQISLNGVARGADGLLGVAGRLVAATAGEDAARRGSSTAIREGTAALTEGLGEILGSETLRELGHSAADSVDGNRGSQVLVAARGARLVIYLGDKEFR